MAETGRNDEEAILAVIEGETAAYLVEDLDGVMSRWVNAPYVRTVGWGPLHGTELAEGWQRVGALIG